MNNPKNSCADLQLSRPWTNACAYFALALVAGISVRAQSVPEAPAQKEPDSIQLSPFEVRSDRDTGYYSRETLQAGRTATELKDTPVALTVLNKQFLDDIAATSLLDAEIWSVNTSPTYNPGLSPTGSNHRGPNFSFFSRNYFLWYVNSDSFSAERFEFGRGPNGVLFGDGNIGGLATTMTKQAYIGRPQSTAITARMDSWGGYRATADISIPAGDRFALRLNLLRDRGTMGQEHSDQDRDGVHLAGTVKLLKNTTFRFEGEAGKVERQRYNTVYAENASYWNGTTFYNGVTPLSTATGSGIARVNTGSTYFVDISGLPYMNWATSYRSTGTGFAMRDYIRTDIPNGGALPRLDQRDFNNLPIDSRYELKYKTATVYLEHQFSDDLFAQIAYNYTQTPYESYGDDQSLNQYYIDVNAVLPNGAPNPNFGKPYAENYSQKTHQENTVSEVRGFVAYRFDTGWWKSNINALAGSRFDKFDYWQARLAQTNGTNPNVTNIANEYHVRSYWDDPALYGDEPNIPGKTFDYAHFTNLILQRKFIDYAQLVSVNKFFDDRLTAILGGRIDHVYQTQRSRISDDPTTGAPVLGATYIPEGETKARTVPGGKAVIDRNASNVNAGLVYYVVPWIGLYGNYSETFATPDAGNNLIDGSLPPISHSESKEYGIKFDLLGDKIYADIRYYDSKQKDMISTTSAANQINAIWTQLGRNDLNGLAYRDTQSLILNGFEFEVTANPTKNLRIIANYAIPRDQRNIDALPGLRAYYAAHVDEWKAAAASNTTIQTNLDTIESTLQNNASFALVNGFTKYRANIYGTYTFDTGPMRGLAVGLGGNFVGPSKIGTRASSFDYFWSDSYFLLSGHVSYEAKIFKHDVKLQLNVRNILDQDDPVNTSVGAYHEKGISSNPVVYIPNAYRYNDPREYILTVSTTF